MSQPIKPFEAMTPREQAAHLVHDHGYGAGYYAEVTQDPRDRADGIDFTTDAGCEEFWLSKGTYWREMYHTEDHDADEVPEAAAHIHIAHTEATRVLATATRR